MTPLLVDALDRQSDCSSASKGVAAARKRRVEYVNRIFWINLVSEGSVYFDALTESGDWELNSILRYLGEG